MGSIVELSPEQRARGLERAAEARRKRSAALAAVRSGEMGLEEAFGDPRLQSAKVELVLRQLPGVGKATASSLMVLAAVSPERRVRGLGRRQRARLLEAVDGLGR